MRTCSRRLSAVALACFLIAALSARPASGDGVVVPPADHDGDLAEQAQEAILVLHEDGRTQDLVLAIKVTARGSSPKNPGRTVARFSWIVPFPSPPEVAPEDARIFTELHRHVSTWPEPLWSTRLRRHMYGSPDSDPAVEVIRRESVGVYDVALVRENQPGALNRWLTREGYRTLEGADDVIGHYRDRGFVFACVKVRDAALKPGKAVHLHPLRFTFDTGRSGRLFFPMRMTGLQQGAFHVNLFAFHPGWLEERASRGGYERYGFRVRYRDWDLPGLRDPTGFAWSAPPSDPRLRSFTDQLTQVGVFMLRRHHGRRFYLNNLRAENLDPARVRAWPEDLWLKPREGGPGPAGWCTRLESDHVRLLTVFSETEARAWLDHAEQAYTAFQKIAGPTAEDTLPANDRIELLVAASRRQGQVVVDRYLPVYLARHCGRPPSDYALFLDQARQHGLDRPVIPGALVGGWVRSGPGSPDLSAYLAGRMLLERHVQPEDDVPVWLIEGYGCLMEHRLVPPIPTPDYKASAYLDRGAEAWRASVEASVKAGGFMGFDRLKLYLAHRSDPPAFFKQAWSRVQFLTEEHPERFRRWLDLMHGGKVRWRESLYQTFRWTDEEFDQAWAAWVREGCRPGN